MEVEGPNGWTGWIRPVKTPYYIRCCDCGLAHAVEFRIHTGKAEFRARRLKKRPQRRKWRKP